MPTFGDFETIDEPIESREDRRHFTRVWQAARVSVKDGRFYAVKCYVPRHGRRAEGETKEELEEHRSLEFLEGVKQIKKASAEGEPYLTPIHEFGLTPSGDGAWYATDFYGDATPVLPRTLRSYITRGGKVDGPALRHTIHSIVLGCLAMKRSRGCSHGNLKTTNVFRAGKPRALRKTPLVLGDAFPVAPQQTAHLDAQNKSEVGSLLKATMEAHDLRAIGELILQLVEVRLLTRANDYDYPVIPAPAWNALGKDGERWRQLCNRLLDPSLSLEKLNLELLERELRPGFVASHAPLVAGAAVLICLVGGGGYFGWRYYEGSRADQRQKLYRNDMDGAKIALTASESDPPRILVALKLVEDALRRSPSDPNAAQLQSEVDAKRDSLFTKAFREGTNDLAGQKFEESLAQLKLATTLKPDDPQAKQMRDEAQTKLAVIAQAGQKEADYQTAMKAGHASFDRGDYKDALAQVGKALLLKSDDADAKQLRDEAQTKLAVIAQAGQKEADYQTAMKAGHASFDRGDYKDALAQVGKALLLKSDDADAKQLRDEAQTKLAAIAQAGQKETDYQTAMKAGHASFDRGDYKDALLQAGNALLLKSDDGDAKQLRDEAQTKLAVIAQAGQKETDYQTAMKTGHASFDRGDYKDALLQAGNALLLKFDDGDAKQLRDEAQTKLAVIAQAGQKEADYQTAMKTGHASFDRGDYKAASAQADHALVLKPNDPEAEQLRVAAQTKLGAITLAAQQEADYQSAMKEGHAAMSRGDYKNASARADEALLLKPEDKDAKELRNKAQTQLAAANQKEADYQTAVKNGKQLRTLGDTDATRLPLALAQFQAALNSKPNDAEATGDVKEVKEKLDQEFTLALAAGSKEASAGHKEEANRQLEKMKVLKPGDSQLDDLAKAIANIAASQPTLKTHPPTNFADVFGRSIPDLDFVWVDGIGPGAGAYVAVNELSWAQYKALGGSENPPDPRFTPQQPAGLDFDKAKAFVDLLNKMPGNKKVKFRLPSLDEYKTLSGVTDFAVIAGLVGADQTAGEKFQGEKAHPREIVAEVSTNKVGLRNVIGNAREWTANGVPFGNSYAWGKSGIYSLTNEPRLGEQIGLRLICESAN